MTHPNERRLREAYDASAGGDIAPLINLMADDVQWHASGRGPVAGDYSGKSGVLDFFARMGALYGDTFRLEVLDVFGNDARGVVLTREQGEHGGRALEFRSAHTYEFGGGVCVRFMNFVDDAYDEFGERRLGPEAQCDSVGPPPRWQGAIPDRGPPPLHGPAAERASHVIFELRLGVERLRRRGGDHWGRGRRRGTAGQTGKNRAGGKDAKGSGRVPVSRISDGAWVAPRTIRANSLKTAIRSTHSARRDVARRNRSRSSTRANGQGWGRCKSFMFTATRCRRVSTPLSARKRSRGSRPPDTRSICSIFTPNRSIPCSRKRRGGAITMFRGTVRGFEPSASIA